MNAKTGKAQICVGNLADLFPKPEIVAPVPDRNARQLAPLIEHDLFLVEETAVEELRSNGSFSLR